MLNGGAAKARKGLTISSISIPQVELFKLVKQLFHNVELEYPCKNKSIDIAIIDHMIAIEYDEPKSHTDKEYDKNRQELIESEGWKFLRYWDYIPTLDELKNDIYSLIWGGDDKVAGQSRIGDVFIGICDHGFSCCWIDHIIL